MFPKLDDISDMDCQVNRENNLELNQMISSSRSHKKQKLIAKPQEVSIKKQRSSSQLSTRTTESVYTIMSRNSIQTELQRTKERATMNSDIELKETSKSLKNFNFYKKTNPIKNTKKDAIEKKKQLESVSEVNSLGFRRNLLFL